MTIQSIVKFSKSGSILMIASCFIFVLFAINYVQAQSEATGNKYSVQVLLSKTHLQPEDAKFKGIKDMEEETCPGIYKYKYVTGKTSNLEEAVQTRLKMIDAGFKDAFIVWYKDGNRAWMKNEMTSNTKPKVEPVKTETWTADANCTDKPKTTSVKSKVQPVKSETWTADANCIDKPKSTSVKTKVQPVTTETMIVDAEGKIKSRSASSKYGIGNPVMQTQPEFPGGNDSLLSYIRKNMKEATQLTVHGEWKQAFIGFKVANTGKVENVKILSGINKELDNSIANMFRSMPAWKPAAIDGHPIDKDYLLPLDLFIVDKGVTQETAIQE